MTHWELINLVIDMRRKQKEYFRTRSKDVLIASKKLEAEVDHEIASWVNECKKPQRRQIMTTNESIFLITFFIVFSATYYLKVAREEKRKEIESNLQNYL